MKKDVDLALACDVEGVVMEIPSSDHLLKYAYGWTEEKAIDLSVEDTKYASDHGLYVAFFTIDSTRASFDTCWKLINTVAIRGGWDKGMNIDLEKISQILEEVKIYSKTKKGMLIDEEFTNIIKDVS